MEQQSSIDENTSQPTDALEAVKWAYFLFLDREAESPQVLKQKAETFSDSRQIREHFLNTTEFLSKNPQYANVEKIRSHRKQPLQVETIEEKALLDEFFSHIKSTWMRLGELEPHWSVLSANKYTQDELAENIDAFYLSGKHEALRIDDTLSRNGLQIPEDGTCIEYGCGVGRVTRWLADRYETLYGFDISASHLELARRYLDDSGHNKVHLQQVNSIEGLEQIPKSDLFYTRIVLQHNPPPIIELLLSTLLGSLKPGGVGIFQVPTDSLNYSFSVEAYLESLKRQNDSHGIEVHLLPQVRVFQLILGSGCIPIEVTEDKSAGEGFISQTFVVQRPIIG